MNQQSLDRAQPEQQRNSQIKKPRTMSKEVKIALITTAGTLLVAIITGIFALMNRPSPSPTPIVSGNQTPTDKSMANYGTINLVFNQPVPHPTATPHNASVSTNSGEQNPYASDMQTLRFDASLQDNTNRQVQWEESDTTDGGTGKSICGFQNGYYHAYDSDPNNASYTSCLAQQTNFADFTYEVQMIIVSGHAGGIFFRSQDAKSSQYSYMFLIRSDGYGVLYAVVNRASGPQFEGLVGRTITSFNAGTERTNTIAVVTRGNQIDLYVNRVGVASVLDRTYRQGGVGVIGWTSSDVVFKNAKVWTA